MPSNCTYGTAWSLGCNTHLGGVQKVYLRTFSGTNNTYTYDSTDTITGTTTSGAWYTIEQRAEKAEFKSGTGEHSADGTNVYTEELGLQFLKYQASSRNLVKSLAQFEVQIIVLTNTGQYFLMGQERGAYLTASSASVGKALSDTNGTSVTLQSKSSQETRECSTAFIATQTFL